MINRVTTYADRLQRMTDSTVNGTACKNPPCETASDEIPKDAALLLAIGGVLFGVVGLAVCCVKLRERYGGDDYQLPSGRHRPVTIREDGTMIVGGEIVPLSALPPSYSSLNFSDPHVRRVLQRSISELPPSYSSLHFKEQVSDSISRIVNNGSCVIEVTDTEPSTSYTAENDTVNHADPILNIHNDRTLNRNETINEESDTINRENDTINQENDMINQESGTINIGVVSNHHQHEIANRESATIETQTDRRQIDNETAVTPNDMYNVTIGTEDVSGAVSNRVTSPETSSKEYTPNDSPSNGSPNPASETTVIFSLISTDGEDPEET